MRLWRSSRAAVWPSGALSSVMYTSPVWASHVELSQNAAPMCIDVQAETSVGLKFLCGFARTKGVYYFCNPLNTEETGETIAPG
jgi:hypothetical protein